MADVFAIEDARCKPEAPTDKLFTASWALWNFETSQGQTRQYHGTWPCDTGQDTIEQAEAKAAEAKAAEAKAAEAGASKTLVELLKSPEVREFAFLRARRFSHLTDND